MPVKSLSRLLKMIRKAEDKAMKKIGENGQTRNELSDTAWQNAVLEQMEKLGK